MSKLNFLRKRMPVLPEYRPMYKIGMVLLILQMCSIGGKSSLIRLHLFNWALKDSRRIMILEQSIKVKELLIGVWGVDPALNMALGYAISEKLISKMDNGSYSITPKGKVFVSKPEVIKLFNHEIKSLKLIGKSITESMITKIAQRWKNEI
jgi:hypothetical protein